MALPVIPDDFTPTLARFGEGWRIGEFRECPVSQILTVKFTPISFTVKVRRSDGKPGVDQ